MDMAQIITVVGFSVGIFAVLLGIVALMWQINNQSSRLEAKIDTQGRDLEAKIDTQGKDLEAKIDAQGRDLEAKIDTQGKDLEAKIDAQGKQLQEEIQAHSMRVSQTELDQARMNGVNSVLLRQAHTHEQMDGAD